MENTQKDEEKNHNKLSVRLNLRLIKYNWIFGVYIASKLHDQNGNLIFF